MIKKNKDLNEETEQLLLTSFEKLRDIPGAENVHYGKNFSKLSAGYELGLVVDFKDKESLITYNKHPKHVEVVKVLQDLKVEMSVVDYHVIS